MALASRRGSHPGSDSLWNESGSRQQTFLSASRRLELRPSSVAGAAEPGTRPEVLGLLRAWPRLSGVPGRRAGTVFIPGENEHIS